MVSESSLPRLFPRILLGVLLALLAALQVHFIVRDVLPLSWDESFHSLLALRMFKTLSGEGAPGVGVLDVSGYYPPLIYILSAPGAFIFGRSLDGLLAVQVLLLLVLVWSTYGLGRRIGDWPTGLLAAWFVATAPMIFGASRTFLLDVPLTAFVTLTLWVLFVFFDTPRPGWAILLGVLTGLSMLVKWTAFLFLLGPLLAMLHMRAYDSPLPHPLAFADKVRKAFVSLIREHTDVVLGVSLAIVIGAAIGLPWYQNHFDHVFKSFAADPVAHDIFARPGTSESLNKLELWGFYLRALGSNQLHLIPALILLGGFCLKFRESSPGRMALFYGWLLAIAAFTFIPLKDPRFTLPAIPLLAVAGAEGLVCALRGAKRAVLALLIAVFVAIGVLQWGMTSYRWITDTNTMLPTPIGEVTLWGPGWHGTAIRIREEWPLDKIVQTIHLDRDHRNRDVLVLSNFTYLHPAVLQFEASLQNKPLRFTYVKNAWKPPEDAIREAHWIITKTGDAGPGFTSRGVPELVQRLYNSTDPLRDGLNTVAIFPLPDGTEAALYERQE